ncbi:MAG: molybdopterin biosynthesis protein [Clostridiales bacterium]|jgi:molybdopterin synthase catalytic subunit|nr:molybdopterin biosynthesis protein [Clostridiales bacterium]HQD41959.1 molybdenum cofactor biosynthesis protein MoaE [Bacillota bacterium]
MSSGKIKKQPPSIDEWLKEAKADPAALQQGMFLIHNGVVRRTPKAKVRQGIDDGSTVKGMEFAYDAAKVEAAVAEAYKMDGIFHVKVWLNEGHLEPGDDIMYVLVGGDIRPHVIDALQFLVGKLKSECVTEMEQIG